MGILFRSGAAVENLALADTFAFDKTGTLTSGELALHKVDVAGDWTEQDVLARAASAELQSEHPIGRSIVREARRHGAEPVPPATFKAFPGEGIEATIGAHTLQLGTREFVSDRSDGRFPESWALVESSTRRVHIFVGEGHRSAMLSFEDDIRANAKGVLALLKKSGRRTMLVTGDREAPAREAAGDVGIDEVLFRQSPEMKLELMTKLAAEGRHVAMVGDGVNDAAALAAAHVSIVMGGRGSDAALEEAGIVLVGDRIANLWEAVRISEVARRIIVQNLVISGGIIVILAIVALTGFLKLPAAVVGHEGSTIVVVLNSLRIFLASRHRTVFD
jgi:Cd2+/Zn2+-exporting ATPase